MLVTGKNILSKARKGNYAVGAFNFVNMESLQAIITAAELEQSPVIVQTTEGAMNYAGIECISLMAHIAAKRAKVPVALHLDHGKDIYYIRAAIRYGYTSVMIDGSHLPFEKNIAITKKVVALAKKNNVSVEAELGTLGGIEDNVSGVVGLTDPAQALEFVKRTGIDSLAIAIGTSHGAYKFKGKSKLDFKRLGEIRDIVSIPLVLHGASGIPPAVVQKAVRYGAKLKEAHGVSDTHIIKARAGGICKINIDSDLRLTFDAAVREVIMTQPEVFDLRKILGPAREQMTDIARKKMQLFGSSGRA
ncbi:MAG: class II fructose-1,6-bisphosphate aldolase [Nanoarchaeota archaeon]|nr:class II fructose-1,6-bisphosphate aldolase [Nanoarchaeota archaeon]MCK5629114.1 class II fructose-1,6-bisphosphate aldolase [Nanoarchaeota archaeon]